MFVDTVNRKSVEHIERSHPLRVTFCQIVVDGNHVNTVSCKCVEEHRQGSYKRFTFTRRHLGNLSLMQNGTTEELYVVVNHIPLLVVAAGNPVVMIYRLVAVDIHKVVLYCKFPVEIVSRNNDVLVF